MNVLRSLYAQKGKLMPRLNPDFWFERACWARAMPLQISCIVAEPLQPHGSRFLSIARTAVALFLAGPIFTSRALKE